MADREFLSPLGSADIKPSFSGLRTITRMFKASGRAATAETVEDQCFRAYGAADDEFTTALLIDKNLSTVASGASATDKILTEVYQEFTAGQKVSVGEDVIKKDEHNRNLLYRKFVCLATEAEGLATASGIVDGVYVANGAEIFKNGVGAVITEAYIEAGEAFAQVGEDEIDYELNGLKRRVRNLIAKGGVAFTGTVGTTAHPTDTGLILAGLSIRESKATTKVKATYLQPGTLSIGKRSLNDGVVQYSYVFLGTEGAVTGTVLSRNIGDHQGLRTYNVTTAANKDGSTLVGVGGAAKLAYSFPKLVTFQAPGVVDIKEFQFGASVSAFADLAAPVEFLVSARVYVYYQTSDALVSGDFTTNSAEGLWNPSQWASKEATVTAGVADTGTAVGAYYNQQALRGYRVSAVATFYGSTGVTYESSGKTVAPSVVKLDESAGELINGRPVYRGVITHLVDSMNQAQVVGGGIVIYRSGFTVKGVINTVVSWTGSAWSLRWTRTLADTMPSTGSGDNIYVFRQATGAWADSYTNRSAVISEATLHTATGDTPTPFTAVWPAGVTLPAATESQSVYYGGSPTSDTFGIGAVAAWIEGRNVLAGGLGTMTLSGGPTNPTGRTFTLGVDFKRALEDVDGNQIYQKTITVATITPA
jgi:hypothetical protein